MGAPDVLGQGRGPPVRSRRHRPAPRKLGALSPRRGGDPGLRIPQACGMRRPPTPDGSTPPHGTSSTYGPSQMAVNHCPQNPKQSPSTSAAWQLTAGPWPPSRWPAPPSPTPMPPRGPRKAITPPAIRSWPKRSRAGGIRRQCPSRPARLSPRPWHASGRPPNL